MNTYAQDILFLENLTLQDIPKVGGKNASLGEMLHSLKGQGVRVPEGFATTAQAYWKFVNYNRLKEIIKTHIDHYRNEKNSLAQTGEQIRKAFLNATFPEELKNSILKAYQELSNRYKTSELKVAVRSSATAEDLPDASFAGQQETYLDIQGESALLKACQKCYASLFTDRAIYYRETKDFNHLQVALSIGVQKMIQNDQSGSGVMFTLDTETGFPEVIIINAGWGLGENIVQGTINPDEYRVFKPLLDVLGKKPIIQKNLGSKEMKMILNKGNFQEPVKNIETTQAEQESLVLSDEAILKLARWGCTIEKHYKRPMDIEWAQEDHTGELFIIQARPETVQSRVQHNTLKNYKLLEKATPILTGISIGDAITTGKVCKVDSPKEIDQVEPNSILVTEMTDPDWVPVMQKVAGIITAHGGRTCHAAIISRELGIPAIVGAKNATEILKPHQKITLSCAEGAHGNIYDGILKFKVEEIQLENLPPSPTALMLNVANPEAAFQWWKLPSEGIGLARMEFIIDQEIKIHPMALVHFDKIENTHTRSRIQELTKGYQNKGDYFVDRLAQGIAQLAASQYPHPTIVRMSDFKTNEYANLIGGKPFEPPEENPMIGFRGASRYYHERYREGFALECRAVKRVREEMGFENVLVMIPFCRTLEEADKVLAVMAENGLKRGENGLQVYVMCEIPSNVILAEEFSDRFDGFSIGSNDLTQLILGVDRDSALLADIFDERNEAVKRMIRSVIQVAHQKGRKVGICGQAPSDHPDFAEFLVEAGIDSISLNPDSFIKVKMHLAHLNKKN